MTENKVKIKVTKDGPYQVEGGVEVQKKIAQPNKEGIPEKWVDGEKLPKCQNCRLCRCGRSQDKPFCDESHTRWQFDGTERDADEPYEQNAEVFDGDGIELHDNRHLCSSARFCDLGKGAWVLTDQSANSENKKMAIQEACDCPSGRLVMFDKKTGKPIEPKLEKSIGIIEDPSANVSGPLFVQGGIPVESADGKTYEIRNRMTLCRCGKSRNKPFCDGSHIAYGFNDGD